MLRSGISRAPLIARRLAAPSKKQMSSGNPLAADSGPLSTHKFHTITLSLTAVAPIYFFLPDSMTDGFVDKTIGVLLAGHVAAHQWIGMNYVATDYVPKVSKALVGPARIANAGLAGIVLLGLGKIAVSSPGGIKGCIKVGSPAANQSINRSITVVTILIDADLLLPSLRRVCGIHRKK